MRFNGEVFDDFSVIEYVRRTLLPSITIGTRGTGGIYKYFSNVEYGPTKIEVDVRVLEKTRADVLEVYHRMSRALKTDKPMMLELRDEPGRYNMAILSGDTQLHTFLNTGFVTLVFECPDPYLYNLRETEMKSVNGVRCLNRGSAPAEGRIIFKFTSSSNEFNLKLEGDSSEIRVVKNFLTHDTLTIDLEKELVWHNDMPVSPTLDSDFFKLPSGFFKVESPNSGDLDIAFRERWY